MVLKKLKKCSGLQPLIMVCVLNKRKDIFLFHLSLYQVSCIVFEVSYPLLTFIGVLKGRNDDNKIWIVLKCTDASLLIRNYHPIVKKLSAVNTEPSHTVKKQLAVYSKRSHTVVLNRLQNLLFLNLNFFFKWHSILTSIKTPCKFEPNRSKNVVVDINGF
jgi:hypothetical protein